MELNGKVEVAEPHYSLVTLNAEQVKIFWPFIRKGLLKIKEKDKRSGQWIPEHVRQRMEAGLAGRIFCETYLCMVDSYGEQLKHVGFVVATCGNDEFVGVPLSLFLWIVYCEAPMKKVMRDVMPWLEKRAADLGLRYIDGISSRLGWGDVLARHGFRTHQVIYRREIQ